VSRRHTAGDRLAKAPGAGAGGRPLARVGTVSADQVLLGVGLMVALAVGSQVLAERLRVPAIIVLLPVGFVAGAVTEAVDPDVIFGDAFPSLVSLAVAVILYDAGLDLDLGRLRGHTRKTVVRLIGLGVPITWGVAALGATWLLGMPSDAALMLGAIVVVSGPTVVGPLLNFVRPREKLQRILSWEGALIDPVGAILGALVLAAIVSTSSKRYPGEEIALFAYSLGTGLAAGLLGCAVLWLVLERIRPGEVLDASTQVATVILVAALSDTVRDDSGLIAAIVMGLVVANRREFDLPARRPFLETLVQLILGVLFVSISATVTPESLRGLVLPSLGVVALLVLVARPLLTAVATLRTDLPRADRMFIGWMAPRGIVAAATAASFEASLIADGAVDAEKILPVTFIVIVATVSLYGLTAAPVARRLGVVRSSRDRPLLVGAEPWVMDLALALEAAGLEVVMWSPYAGDRRRISEAGLEVTDGELLAAAAGEGGELEGITAVLLLSDQDEFNALASRVLEGSVGGRVYRLTPSSAGAGALAPFIGTPRLFRRDLTGRALAARHRAGERPACRRGDGELPEDVDLLFVVRASGELAPAVDGDEPERLPGDVAVVMARPEPVPPEADLPAQAPQQRVADTGTQLGSDQLGAAEEP
jgi:NhaP-type Na+/H+ or K+/H+ antiporter